MGKKMHMRMFLFCKNHKKIAIVVLFSNKKAFLFILIMNSGSTFIETVILCHHVLTEAKNMDLLVAFFFFIENT